MSNDDLGKAFFEYLQKGYNGIRLVDFDDITQNSYVVVTELPYENGDDNFRPDIVVLINGMPLSFIEVKRQNNREGILAERERMTRRFSNPIYKRYVNITQYTVFSNNSEYDDAPELYIERYKEKLGDEYSKHCENHALPENFETMDYMEFLNKRRNLMAQIIKKAYMRL